MPHVTLVYRHFAPVYLGNFISPTHTQIPITANLHDILEEISGIAYPRRLLTLLPLHSEASYVFDSFHYLNQR
jgi:hypothetical protein